MYRHITASLLHLFICVPFALEAADPPKKFVKDESDSDFTRRDFHGENLSNHNLENCVFVFANLREVRLRDSNLRAADFSNASLGGADLTGADLRETKWDWAGIQNTTFDKANLSGADLSSASVQKSSFLEANLRNVKGIMDITHANFTGADLRGANLQDSKDYGVNSAIFTGAKYDRTTRWPRGFDVEKSGAILTRDDEEEIKGDTEKVGERGETGETGRPGEPDDGAAASEERLFVESDITEDGFLSGKEKVGFELLDSDGDGIVTKSEFLSGQAALRKPAELFRTLDRNEDFVLSGNEISPEVKKYDADGDGRITQLEYFAEFVLPSAPEVQPAPGGGGASHAAVIDALAAGDASALYANFHPELQRLVDLAILQVYLDIVRSEMGEITEKSTDDISLTDEVSGVLKFVRGVDTIPCANGSLKVTTDVAEGKVIAFSLQSPRLTSQVINQKMFGILQDIGDKSDRFAKQFTPLCSEFVRTLFDGGAEAAFALLDPRIQADFNSKGGAGKLAAIAESFGPISTLELETFRVEGTLEKEFSNFAIGLAVARPGKPEGKAIFSFEIDGLKAVMVGYSFEEGLDPAPPAPPRTSPTPADPVEAPPSPLPQPPSDPFHP